MRLGLDATYSVGEELSGVGVYSREILWGLASAHPGDRFTFCYRPHRFARSFRQNLPANANRRLLLEHRFPPAVDLFHGLNQRMPGFRARRAVCTFHDLFVLTGEYSTPEFRVRFARQAREAAQRSDLVIAVSRFTAQRVQDLLGVESSRLRVAPHGTRFRGPAAPDEARRNLILHVGVIQRRKNVARLVEAFERTPPGWRLVLAGGRGFGAGEILARIEASPRRREIDVLGHVPDSRLHELYQSARVFAFPSLDEGFGIPLLEAMASGVPAVVSSRSALPEVAGPAALLVDPENVEELVEALRRLTGDADLRETLRRAGIERSSHFQWEHTVEKTWQVYRELN